MGSGPSGLIELGKSALMLNGATMAEISSRRLTAQMDGEFVVFLIGMRINKWWKVHKWLPVAMAMGRMMKELETRPETGFLGRMDVGRMTMVQYWKSFDHLEAYARSPENEHWPAWAAFNKALKACRGDVGIWHETYVIEPGRYESVYSGMPPFGLGKAGRLLPATGNREAARERMRNMTNAA